MTRRRAIVVGIASAIVIVHVAIAASLVMQPLGVNRQPPGGRSLIWKLHHDTVHRTGPGSDFFAIYHAAIKRARGESPYDHKETPRVTPDFYPFRYLPIVAQTLGRASTALEPRVAYVTWLVMLELLLVALLIALWRVMPASPWRAGLAAVLLLSSPYFLELHIGQFTFATCGLLAIGLALLDRSSRRSAVVGTAAFMAAVLIKVFPLAACAALIRNRRGLVAVTTTIAVVLVTTLPYFIAHPDDWSAFIKVNFGDTGTEGFHGGNYGFLYLVFLGARALGGHAAVLGFLQVARVWQLVVLGATAGLVVWRRPTMLTGGVALACAHMISYKHVWEHHASGAVVLGVFLLVRLVEDRAWCGRWVALGATLALALPTPFVLIDGLDPAVYDPTPQWAPFWQFVLPACKGLPMFVLWVVALIQSYRERDRSAQVSGVPSSERSAG